MSNTLKQRIERTLSRHCEAANRLSYVVNNQTARAQLIHILYSLWCEMKSYGLYCNFEEFPDNPIIITPIGDVSAYTFRWRETPNWYIPAMEYRVNLF